MKHTFTLIFTALVLVSCGNNKTQSVEDIIATGDLEQIRAKKAELDAQQAELDLQLKELTAKIKEIDPQQKIPLITTIAAEETVFEHFVELQGSVDTKKNLVIYP